MRPRGCAAQTVCGEIGIYSNELYFNWKLKQDYYQGTAVWV